MRGVPEMKILIAGGSGLIGSAVEREARAKGYTVKSISIPRPPKGAAHLESPWDIALTEWTSETFAGYDVVLFFGGETINSRWTNRKKRRIILSRQKPCERIARLIAELAAGCPSAVVSASATGFYGDRGNEELTEQSPVGKRFLAETTADWEAVWEPARQAGVRVVNLRLGVVLSAHGGALKMMLPQYRLGLGGPMGSGDQWMPWISLPDAARLAVFCAETEDLSGPVNAVAPQPAMNRDFSASLGRAVKRPAFLPVPAIALKVAFGQMAQETVLASCRVIPEKALNAGFEFGHPTLGIALPAVM